ncbi:MAG TPA: transcription antitermination factor NusB [Thermotogales bacterium]|nr:transcription antitermination factor NusB [Thermotogales bacterium]
MREAVFKAIFQYDFTKEDPNDALEMIIKEENLDGEIERTCRRFVKGIIENLEKIDSLIKAHLFKWSFNRLSSVDRNVLRLGVYELLFENDIPIEVTLNEAIEIAKKYGSEKSGKFVNGILDRIAKNYVSKHKFAL